MDKGCSPVVGGSSAYRATLTAPTQMSLQAPARFTFLDKNDTRLDGLVPSAFGLERVQRLNQLYTWRTAVPSLHRWTRQTAPRARPTHC